MDLSSYIEEKNKISNDYPWLTLLEVNIPGIAEPIRVVRNTENIEWKERIYQAFPFQLEEMNENGKELSQVNLSVSNVDRVISSYLEATGGAIGTEVTIRVIHAAHLDLEDPAVEVTFAVQQIKADANWVVFVLSPGLSTQVRIPNRIYLKDWCPYQFKEVECGYEGPETRCKHTAEDCKKRNNYPRFGGEPGLLTGGFYASNR